MTKSRERAPSLQRYSVKELTAFCHEFLKALGCDEDEAEMVADGVVTSATWWHPSRGQGIEKLVEYAESVSQGGTRPGVEMRWVRSQGATAVLDANRGFGYRAGRLAVDKALELAASYGISLVAVRNSNHFGSAGFHAMRAAERGCIGWVMTNALAEMAPWGAAKPVLGTNPWGIAVPRKDGDPLIIDMALTTSGKGAILWHHRAGLAIPPDWALTQAGDTTTVALDAMAGALLPIGGYKGAHLSLFTDILAGVMTGSLFGTDVYQDPAGHDVGHVAIVIDPSKFMSLDEFDSRLRELLSAVASASPIDPARPVRLPGEIELAERRRRLDEGVPVQESTVAALKKLASELQVEDTL